MCLSQGLRWGNGQEAGRNPLTTETGKTATKTEGIGKGSKISKKKELGKSERAEGEVRARLDLELAVRAKYKCRKHV
jgi:hypothetical protein